MAEKQRVHPLADGGLLQLLEDGDKWKVVRGYARGDETEPDTYPGMSYADALEAYTDILQEDVMETDE